MTLGKKVIVCAIAFLCCGSVLVLSRLWILDRIVVNASVSPDGNRLLVSLVNRSGSDARIVGNEGACGEGGCIVPMTNGQLSELMAVGAGKERVFTFATRRVPDKKLSCSILIHVDDGQRLRHFEIWVQDRPDGLGASVEERTLQPEGSMSS